MTSYYQAKVGLEQLVERFSKNYSRYTSPDYNETELRVHFVNKLFELLGWDVSDTTGQHEVFHEERVQVEEDGNWRPKHPDYGFRIDGQVRFYVETKKPYVKLKTAREPAFQLRRYGWSRKLTASVLTDFEEFSIYDCRVPPKLEDEPHQARLGYYNYTDYVDKWDEIAELFSRDAVLNNHLDEWVRGKEARGTVGVDDAFLKEMEGWRELLAQDIALHNPSLTQRQLNMAVQTTIDRIVFLRICEDRQIEGYGRLEDIAKTKPVYNNLTQLFRAADAKYNSGLFHFDEEPRREEPDKLTLGLTISDNVLQAIIGRLYYPSSPYVFSVLPADILGQIYERFLGKVIELTPETGAKVVEKSEVRKAGGVYYTPTYIVDYIVDKTIGELVKGKTPNQIAKLRILDPACGSGSFLIGAYQFLIDWHTDWYVSDNEQKHQKAGHIRKGQDGFYTLTTAEKKRILINNIYGVDLDQQAVEVTKLSLLLKMLEGETAVTTQLQLFAERVLPDLENNIRWGNSLIGPDFYEGKQISMFEEEELYHVNVFDWYSKTGGFGSIMAAGGFDAIIGNPPYLKIGHIENVQRTYFFQRYKACIKRYDAFGLFVEKSIELLKPSGLYGMIIPSTILNNLSFTKLRLLLLQKVTLTTFVNLGGRIFPHVNNDTLIMLFAQGRKEGYQTEVFDVLDYGGGLSAAQKTVEKNIQLSSPPDYTFELRVLYEIDQIFSKIRSKSLKLGDICTCFQGFVTGEDKAFIVSHSVIQENNLETILCEPAVFGSEVARYKLPQSVSSVLYLTWDTDINQFPNVKKWLEPFRANLEQRRETKLGRMPWHSLHWPRNREKFERKSKILVQKIRNLSLKRRIIATLDTNGLFAFQTLYVIYSKVEAYDNRYILGLLNSTLLNFIFAKLYIDISIKAAYLTELPIYEINFDNPSELAIHDRIVGLVENILNFEQQLTTAPNPQVHKTIQSVIEDTDRQIDGLVYQLYGLSDDDIALIEKSNG